MHMLISLSAKLGSGFTLGSSIAEIVSAYPTSGGLYMASGSLGQSIEPRSYLTHLIDCSAKEYQGAG